MDSRDHHSAANRRGSLIIEAVVASALLATAVVAVTHLGVASKQLGNQADAQILATLEAVNILERLQGADHESLQTQAAEIQESYSADASNSATIKAAIFADGRDQAVHLQVVFRIGDRARASVDDWRFKPTEIAPASDDTKSADDSGSGEKTVESIKTTSESIDPTGPATSESTGEIK